MRCRTRSANDRFLGISRAGCEILWSEGQASLGNALLRISPAVIDERQPCSLEGRLWITAEARLDDRVGLIEHLRNAENNRRHRVRTPG